MGGYLATARLLLESGADVNLHERKNPTPLIKASRNSHPDMVELLLQHGAEVNFRFENKGDALSHTINGSGREGKDEVVDLLLRRGADVNVTYRNGVTALSTAAMCGLPAIVELLLLHGAEFRTVIPHGTSTALDVAMGRHPDGSSALVGLLRERGGKTHGELTGLVVEE